jgi:hypothetical protein
MTPIYDIYTMPTITYPLASNKGGSTRYLGNRKLNNDEYAEISIHSVDNTEANKLHNFWKTDCINGKIPFKIALPIFGRLANGNIPNALVKFIDDLQMNKQGKHWTSSIKVKVIETYEATELYPSEELYPSDTLYPI